MQVAGVLIVVALLGSFVGVLRSGSNLSPHSGLPHSGGSQLKAASESLRGGAGPAAGHPVASAQSPGGYTWSNVTGSVSSAPSGRVAAMTWDASDGYVLLYGWASSAGYFADTWSYSNGTWTNLTASVSGSPAGGLTSYWAMMAYDPSTAKVVLELPTHNDTWTYHAKTWTNITATAGSQPPSVTFGTLTTDTTDGEIISFGGLLIYSTGYNTATWVFKNGAWSNITSLSPFNFGRIAIPAVSDDPVDHGVLAFAISFWGASVYRPATFLFAAGVWTNLTPTAGIEPPIPYGAGMGYLPSLAAVVLSEGAFVNSTGSLRPGQATWEYANHAWTDVTRETGPQPDNGVVTAVAVDSIDGVMVQFGGQRVQGPIVYPSTYLFSSAPKVSATASRAVVDLGQSVSFNGTVSGVSPVTLGWNFGDSTTGTGTSPSHTYPRAGVFTAVATATDFVGATSTAVVSIEVNPALAVTANGTPSSGTAGAWETLQSTVTGGTAPFTFAWTLGDGSTSTSGSLGHVYASSGSYVVNVTVTDGTGATAKASFTQVVKAAPSTGNTGSASLTSGTGLGLLIGLVIAAVAAIAFLGLWMSARKGRGGPPQPYNAGGTGTMGSPPSSGPPPGVGGSPPPPGM